MSRWHPIRLLRRAANAVLIVLLATWAAPVMAALAAEPPCQHCTPVHVPAFQPDECHVGSPVDADLAVAAAETTRRAPDLVVPPVPHHRGEATAAVPAATLRAPVPVRSRQLLLRRFLE